ncbi:hypothetical protein [Streptomyces sp. WAC05374]|uniref:hypothetical protein n=1 Tax=Streptomyces sp. WAC05374 TaxID=2487420 RepID=UPI001F22C90A|nr:hypothetical protein [Streptomyces sp. WAC05374]
MGRIGDVGPGRHRAPVVCDGGWAAGVRCACVCAAVFWGLLLVADACAGSLTWWRAGLWAVLALVLLVVLTPPRVSARSGLLVSRGLLSEHSVRTDRLVAVRRSGGVAQRLILRDAEGGRVELDPRVLVANPPLWRVLDEDARACLAAGLLVYGAHAMRQLSARVDGETAQAVFKVSGLG